MPYRRPSILLIAAALAVSAAGCDNRVAAVPERATTVAPGPSSSSASSAATPAPSNDERAAAAVARATAPSGTTERAGDRTAVAMDDSSLTAKVKAAIVAEPGLDSLDIHVSAQDGTVTLSGQVDTATKRERATQIATQVSGVKNVVDQLDVKG